MNHCLAPQSLVQKFLSAFVAFTFILHPLLPINLFAQEGLVPFLPPVGTMVQGSPSYTPPMVTGITLHPEDPFKFDFIIDTGDDDLQGELLKEESQKLISYFMAALTVPEDDLWVNLSPYESNRIMAQGLGSTALGRDMLAQDYILKQFTSSLIYPEEGLGSQFWQRVYQKAQEKYGTIEIATDIFNKVWIIPQKAVVYVNPSISQETGINVFVSESHLKVMLEEDYLSLEHHDKGLDVHAGKRGLSQETKAIFREILIPEIEREVNEGKNFANLRQIFNSMILATWYKKNLKESILGKIYVNQNKVHGIDLEDKEIKTKIYDQYVEAFKKGVFNFIREDYDAVKKTLIPRKYFSGGVDAALLGSVTEEAEPRAIPTSLQKRAADRHLVSVAVNGRPLKSADQSMLVIKNPKFAKSIEIARNHDGVVVTDLSAEIMLPDTGDRIAMLAHGKGGLGLLQLDQLGNYSLLGGEAFSFFGVFPGYEHYVDEVARLRQRVDWSGNGIMKPVMVIENGEEKPLKFFVDFRGIDGQGNAHPNGRSYEVEIFTVDLNGTPLLFIRQPEINDHLYPGYPFSDAQVQQFAFFSRAYVELMKKLNIAPDIVRLSEGHMVFVPQAIKNDMEHLNGNGGKSVFSQRAVPKQVFESIVPDHLDVNQLWAKLVAQGWIDERGYRTPAFYALKEYTQLNLGIEDELTLRQIWKELKKDRNSIILTTTHTPEAAAVVQKYGEEIEQLKHVAGWDLVNENLVRTENGVRRLNVLEGLYYASEGMNSVSYENETVAQMLLYPKDGSRKTIGLPNGSDEKNYTMPEILSLIDQKGIEGITADEIDQLKIEAVRRYNNFLKDAGKAPFDERLITERPVFGSAHRLVLYKEEGMLIPLAKWITGDRDKDYEVTNENPYLPVGFKLGKGLGGLLALGGQPYGEAGHHWAHEFGRLEAELHAEYRGSHRFSFIPTTGTSFMALIAAATTFWIHTPWPTREASGTGHHRPPMNFGRVVATVGAGHSISFSSYSGHLIDVFKGEPLEKVIHAFQNPFQNLPYLERFRYEAAVELVATLREFSRDFYAWKEQGDLTHIMKAKLSAQEFYDTASAEVFVTRYLDWFHSAIETEVTGGNIVDTYNNHRAERRILETLRFQNKDIGNQLLNPQELRSLHANSMSIDELEKLHRRLTSIRAEIERPGTLNGKDRRVLARLVQHQIELILDAIDYKKDAAMLTKGGIDLNPNNMELKEEGASVDFKLPTIELPNMGAIDGILPVIINITPITNLQVLLGSADTQPGPLDLGQAPTTEPMDKSDSLQLQELQQLSFHY